MTSPTFICCGSTCTCTPPTPVTPPTTFYGCGFGCGFGYGSGCGGCSGHHMRPWPLNDNLQYALNPIVPYSSKNKFRFSRTFKTTRKVITENTRCNTCQGFKEIV